MKSSYFLDKMREQEKWRVEESLNLLPSENMTSPQARALLSSDFVNRYTLPINAEYGGSFIENSYRGTRITTEIELSAEKLACEVFKSAYACVQPLSGHIAAMIVIKSMANRGGSMCAISSDVGGYDGYMQNYIPEIFGMTSWSIPFDAQRQNINTAEAAESIRRKRPSVVILGSSYILFPYDMGPIRDACAEVESKLVYDGSHVLGLIAGGEFQRPLKEGADVLYGSTHKSFFGPQGGLIVTDKREANGAIRKNLTWRIIDNAHWNRVASLGQVLLEMKRFGPAYAKQVVRNSQRLGKELSERGFPVMYEELGFSKSHQLLIDAKEIQAIYGMSINDFSVRLERSNLIIDAIARLGTAEITRLGVKEKDLPELADIFMESAIGKNVKKKVKAFRDRFDMAYRFR